MTVVVVGAGPVGLTAALLLARRGRDVLVLERQAHPYPLPRAVHLDDESLRVLQAAGVAEAFAAVSRPMAGLRLLDGAHRTLAEFPRGAGEHGWRFVTDHADTFDGHGYCADDNWIVRIDQSFANQIRPALGTDAALNGVLGAVHPNPRGHVEYGDAISQALGSSVGVETGGVVVDESNDR